MTDGAGVKVEGTVREIRVPREVANADSVYLVAWLAADGALVEAGAELCSVDTSKAAVSVAAENAGYVRHHRAVGDEVPVGGVLGFLTSAPDTPLPDLASSTMHGVPEVISAKALRKMEELGLTPAQFAGRGPVRERDVIAFAEARRTTPPATTAGDRTYRLEPFTIVQRRVAAAMEAGAAVPAAYLSRDVEFGPVRQRAADLSRESRLLVTPVDLLVAAVARASVAHPIFNATFVPPASVGFFDDVNVGVAVDVEHELYVVVVKQAQTMSIQQIAVELRRLQMLAQRRRLAVGDLTGGTVTVTSMLGRGVHRFQPILHPGETAIVALADPVPSGTHAQLTVGFDHRVANGSHAAAFIATLDRELSAGPPT